MCLHVTVGRAYTSIINAPNDVTPFLLRRWSLPVPVISALAYACLICGRDHTPSQFRRVVGANYASRRDG